MEGNLNEICNCYTYMEWVQSRLFYDVSNNIWKLIRLFLLSADLLMFCAGP